MWEEGHIEVKPLESFAPKTPSIVSRLFKVGGIKAAVGNYDPAAPTTGFMSHGTPWEVSLVLSVLSYS
ncbi:hypothetical protein GCM10007418_09430 [Halopseudomonas salina]|uniref:Uncharacterized protein n=1 Tax=Halopseudomonas salina TaxID=1323744 RepID=A0ABQ1P751_9GAMM|nr:hypothetical protein GCM10007418_09430 [Halopseudomonas salina]